MRAYMKKRSKQLGLTPSGQARINTAGCLNRCEDGPVMVVYPEAVWYSFVDEDDIDEILEEHLLKGNIVERLNIDSESRC
jgi:(2Fe-2S) ferredoxin